MCSISAFGQQGPLKSKPGYDFIGAAYAGFLDMNGDPNAQRSENRAALIETIEQWVASTPRDEEAMRLLEEQRVPVAPVLSVVEAMNHPHLRERQTVRTVTDRVAGELQLPGFPLRFSEFPHQGAQPGNSAHLSGVL
jgi:crotonobetainyl-CoA:carnitine CoA-transferase CaiB-like acyl-CoA transferase